MTTLIEFAYETGDSSCRYWQDFVIVKSDESIDLNSIEDSITSYMESEVSGDKDYPDMTEEVMNTSGYTWYFLDDRAVSIDRIHTFWI